MSGYHDKPYIALIKNIIANGSDLKNREGDLAKASFQHQLRFDLSDNTIPLLTTRKLNFDEIIERFLKSISSSSNNPIRRWPKFKFLNTNKNTTNNISLHMKASIIETNIDQLVDIIEMIKSRPYDRRLIVTHWNVSNLDHIGSPSVYGLQFFVTDLSLDDRLHYVDINKHKENCKTANDLIVELSDRTVNQVVDTQQHNANIEQILNQNKIPTKKLSMSFNQRSVDAGKWLPVNIVQYATLLRMISDIVNYSAGELVWNGGNVHVYHQHITQLLKQAKIKPSQSPTLIFTKQLTSIDDVAVSDIVVSDYQPADEIDFLHLM